MKQSSAHVCLELEYVYSIDAMGYPSDNMSSQLWRCITHSRVVAVDPMVLEGLPMDVFPQAPEPPHEAESILTC